MTSATAKVPKPAVESANPIAWVTALIAAIIAVGLNSENSSACPSVAAKLRPDRTLVALRLAGRAAGCSAAGNSGAACT